MSVQCHIKLTNQGNNNPKEHMIWAHFSCCHLGQLLQLHNNKRREGESIPGVSQSSHLDCAFLRTVEWPDRSTQVVLLALKMCRKKTGVGEFLFFLHHVINHKENCTIWVFAEMCLWLYICHWDLALLWHEFCHWEILLCCNIYVRELSSINSLSTYSRTFFSCEMQRLMQMASYIPILGLIEINDKTGGK